MHVRWTYLVLFYKMPICFLTIFWLNCYWFMSKCESSSYMLDTSLLWSEYLCLPKVYMLNPNPKMAVLGQGPLGSDWAPLWLIWWIIHLQCGRSGFNPWAGKVSVNLYSCLFPKMLWIIGMESNRLPWSMAIYCFSNIISIYCGYQWAILWTLEYPFSFYRGENYELNRNIMGSTILLGRKVMTNLDSIFKSRDITFPTDRKSVV